DRAASTNAPKEAPHAEVTAAGFAFRSVAAVVRESIRIWDLFDGTARDVHDQGTRQASAVAWDPAQQRLLAGSGDGVLRVWDLSRDPANGNVGGPLQNIWSVAFATSGQRAAICGGGDNVGVWQEDQEDIRWIEGTSTSSAAIAIDARAHWAATLDVNG